MNACRHCGEPIVDPDRRQRYRRRYCDSCRAIKAWEGGNAGSKNGQARLDETKVLAIRASAETDADLARRYGVVPSIINRARNRVTWRHV